MHPIVIFEPNLVSENARTNSLITQAQFNPNATCQYISCNPSVRYPVFSDKPFFLQTDVMIGQPNCRPNNHVFEFNLGSPIELYITCPLIFGSRFLDISHINLIQNDFTVDTSRRLFFNATTNLATLHFERDYICEAMYGERVLFSIRVLANDVIQLLAGDNSDSTITNGTHLIDVDIPNSISCLTQTSGNSAKWFVDSNPNRSLNESPTPVSTDTTAFPYVTNPRVGRSNLIFNGTIGSGKEGYYSCIINPTITVGIFSQNPVPPTATISPGQTVIQVVIGTNTPVLNCEHSNPPHPLPIYFRTGSISSSTATLDTNLLLESNSGEYTCTASNVLGMSTDTITIVAIPPPPQFLLIEFLPQASIYFGDEIRMECRFTTFANISSPILINWYKDGVIVEGSDLTTILTVYTGDIAISTLTISEVQFNDEGIYNCQATVGDSQVSISQFLQLNLNLPPNPISLQLTSTLQAPYLTERTQLQCQFVIPSIFRSALKIDWYHNTSLLISNSTGIQISLSNKDTSIIESTLSISSTSFSEAGEYHCTSRLNALGSAQVNSTPFILKVRIPPAPTLVGVSIPNTKLYNGDTFSLSCQFMTLEHFLPTLEINWFHNGTRLVNILNIMINTENVDSTAKNSSLLITDAVLLQSGTYTCSSNVLFSPITSTSFNLTISAFFLPESKQNIDNSIIIMVPLLTIILLLISGFVIILSIWILRRYTSKSSINKLPTPKEDQPHLEMVQITNTGGAYYNLDKDLSGEPQYYAKGTRKETESVDTTRIYACIDEVDKEMKEDRDCEVSPVPETDTQDTPYYNVSCFYVH